MTGTTAVGNRVVRTAGRTVGLYSPAVVIPPGVHTVHVSGVLSVDPDGGSVGHDDFETQMRTVFRLLGETLAAGGSSFAELVKMTTYLVDPGHIDEFYRIREELFAGIFPGGRPPGNTLLVVQRLVRPEFLIEIEGVATSSTGGEGADDELVG
ncbi:RidA family protein [Pseudonocardia kongjuensis]|uniref:RidA family protein n=1 Tax=Pseudonocardia kongjuensis TaxID=102227 RepID=A0ABP4IMZ4_9PSEU